jgi:nucleotide-binding universal stress UspA family protein
VEFPVPYATGLGGWVPDPIDLTSVARQWLEQATAGVEGADLVVLEGHPAAEVCDWAAANDVDLLVCAGHRNLAARITLGSFAHYLVNHSPAPVLVMRPEAEEDS